MLDSYFKNTKVLEISIMAIFKRPPCFGTQTYNTAIITDIIVIITPIISHDL